MSENPKVFYEFGPFRMDGAGHQLWRNGKEVALTPKAAQILLLLLEHPGETLLKDELLKAVWPDTFVEDNNLADNISILREALGDNPKTPQYIKTIHRRGYRFVAEVKHRLNNEAGMNAMAEAPTGVTTVADPLISQVTLVGKGVDEPVSARPSDQPLDVTQVATLRRLVRKRVVVMVIAATVILASGVGYFVWSRYLRSAGTPTLQRELTITRVTNSGKSGIAAISPDGKLIAYAQNSTPGNPGGGTGSLYVRQIGANHEVELLEPGDRIFGGVAFSPDSSLIYHVVYDQREPKGALYRIPALGGPTLRLIGDISSMFSLSPDGGSVAFYRYDPERKELNLMIAPLDGTVPLRLMTRPYNEVAFTGIPAWSPDGQMIAFVPDPAVTKHGKDGESETIYGIDITSGAIKPLTDAHWFSVGTMAWMPDGHGLVVIASRLRTGNQLYSLSYPDGVVRRITSGVQGFGNYALSITSDSSALVAASYESSAQLWLIGADGNANESMRLTTGDYDGRRGLAGLAEGRIIYVVREGGEYDLWTVKEDGTEARPLTADSFLDREITSTPEGRYLVFTSDRAGGSHIYRADRDGGNVQQLTLGEAESNMPDCSPDGQWVAYALSQNEKTTLWKVSINGGTPLQLTNYQCVAPSFSPDGGSISCIIPAETLTQRATIAVIPAAGGAPVKSFNVVPFSWSYLSARWTPDGQALVFQGSNGFVSNLWKQPLAGGPPRQLTDFKTDIIYNYAFSGDRRHLILARGQTLSNVVLIKNFH